MKVAMLLVCLVLASCGGGSATDARVLEPMRERCAANLDEGKCPVDAIVPVQGGYRAMVPV